MIRRVTNVSLKECAGTLSPTRPHKRPLLVGRLFPRLGRSGRDVGDPVRSISRSEPEGQEAENRTLSTRCKAGGTLGTNENLPMDDPFAVAVRAALCMVGPTGLVVILYLVGLDAYEDDAVPKWSASRPEVG
jgi:hypothetical protein